MRILVSNDDGIYAEGIQTLVSALEQIGEVYVVAPLEERSTSGHALTLNNPLRIVEIGQRSWGCSGYPADCIFMGVAHLARKIKFDVVVSGINRGANLGQDVYYSGTVAAAREGAFHRFPAIAISTVIDHLIKGEKIYYESAADFVKKFLAHGGHRHCSPFGVVNINVPNLPTQKLSGVEYCTLGFRTYTDDVEERVDSRHRPYYWIGGQYRGPDREEGTDCNAIENGKIALSLINLLGKKHFDDGPMRAFIREMIL